MTSIINIPVEAKNLYYSNGILKNNNGSTYENINIYNLIGTSVLEINGKQEQIDCSYLPSGMYFFFAYDTKLKT